MKEVCTTLYSPTWETQSRRDTSSPIRLTCCDPVTRRLRKKRASQHVAHSKSAQQRSSVRCGFSKYDCKHGSDGGQQSVQTQDQQSGNSHLRDEKKPGFVLREQYNE